MSHVPPPSPWPFLLGADFALFAVLWWFDRHGAVHGVNADFCHRCLGGNLMGWCHQVIKEKPIAHDLNL